ncbi:MAG: hypothetical protein Ct9H90mP9_3850 [Pseudomonadota bacterium]|nr:MAG: hypothetical protein Ct9H90mP9_3850 [Pseudomonadota bacterium]
MIAKTNSASVLGIDAHPVDVEVDVSIGLSTFNIVGLPDGTIKESRDRSQRQYQFGFKFSGPADRGQSGPRRLAENRIGFDLPMPWPCWGRLLFSDKSWKK